MSKEKILITGGAGFVGSYLSENLCIRGYEVVIVDNLMTGLLSNVPDFPHCKFIKCDVNNYNEIAPIMKSFRFDYIFHYAALAGVQKTLENPVSVLRDIDGFNNIFTLAKSIGTKRIFFSSSSEVYGEPVQLPQQEQKTPLNSKLPYAVVKNLGESFCRSYHKEFGLDYTIFRFFNTYGSRQSSDFVISKFLIRAFKNDDIPIYGDGTQTRTFCYINDNVDACISSLETGIFTNDVVNIGSDRLTTIKDLAEMIIHLTGSSSKIIYLDPLKEGDMTRRQPDVTKMKQLLNRDFKPLKEGLLTMIKNTPTN